MFELIVLLEWTSLGMLLGDNDKSWPTLEAEHNTAVLPNELSFKFPQTLHSGVSESYFFFRNQCTHPLEIRLSAYPSPSFR